MLTKEASYAEMNLRIGIVAAEPSGDLLASELMKELKDQHSNIEFEGIGGLHMEAQGFRSWAPMERLSVIGLFEVIRYLPKIILIKRDLIKRWKKRAPHIFIGVDAPDFNINLEKKLKDRGVITIHYVCPSIWAWREKRVNKIYKSVDLILSIFPFEKNILNKFNIRNHYIGHTLATKMPMQANRAEAKALLQISEKKEVLAILPGSREIEVKRLARPFLETALICKEAIPDLHIVVPLANKITTKIWREKVKKHAPNLSIQEVKSETGVALTASDVALMASGTATLEGVLCKRPMVIGYKLNQFTYLAIKFFRLMKIKNFSLANILSKQSLAPEFLQSFCEANLLAPKVLEFFHNKEKVYKIEKEYTDIHKALSLSTNKLAASVILDEVKKTKINF